MTTSGIDGNLTEVPAFPAGVGIRLVATHHGHTRRVDIVITGEQAHAFDGEATHTFPTAELWPAIRDLLPQIDVVRAAPRGLAAPPHREPPATFAEDASAFVALTTVGEEGISVRSWLATDVDLWSCEARADGSVDVRPAAPGAIADLLLWDLTGALERAVARREAAS